MARKMVPVIYSDMSGAELPSGTGAVVTVVYNDVRKGAVKLDVSDAEADTIGAKGVKIARRGRKPKAAAPEAAPVTS